MTRRTLALAAALLVEGVASASTFHVAATGADTAAGTQTAPWRTIQHAADAAQPGDTVTVHAGTYAGFTVERSGTAAAPIAFVADADVHIDGAISADRDAIHVDGASYIRIEGFTVTNATRSGISALECDHVTIRNNKTDQNAKWGIFTAFCDDLLIENNEASRSAQQHGIYTSNTSDHPIIRGNKIWGNAMCGIHMNGDISIGGDGIISNALVENNKIYDNGRAGGSAINGDGVVNAVIRNNVLDNNHASGISLYMIDGGAPSTGNRVINNTVRQAADGRATINIQDGSTGNTLRNNILIHPTASKLVLDLCPTCVTSFVSDHNATIGTFQPPTDSTSFASTEAALFTNAASGDLSLSATSAALDKGVTTDAPATDIAGTARPQGTGIDLGAYEHCTGACTGTPPGGGSGSGDGSGDGDGSGSGSGGGPDYSGSGTGSDDSPSDDGGGCNAVGHAGLASALASLVAVRRRRRRG